jgi:transcriptional regulator with XRE-family HTH domain
MTDGAAQDGAADGTGAERPEPPCGAESAAAGGAPGGAPGRVPATLYERWRTAFRVDGVAFGKKVRELREARGWSQKDVHDRTGVPISTISELEKGLSGRPHVPLSMTLAQCFGYEHPGAMLGLPQPARPPGTDPAGPRTSPGEREPSAMGQEAERVLTGLLRGLWTAQEERGAPRGRVTRLVALTMGVAELADDPPAAAPPPAYGDPPAAEPG